MKMPKERLCIYVIYFDRRASSRQCHAKPSDRGCSCFCLRILTFLGKASESKENSRLISRPRETGVVIMCHRGFVFLQLICFQNYPRGIHFCLDDNLCHKDPLCQIDQLLRGLGLVVFLVFSFVCLI